MKVIIIQDPYSAKQVSKQVSREQVQHEDSGIPVHLLSDSDCGMDGPTPNQAELCGVLRG